MTLNEGKMDEALVVKDFLILGRERRRLNDLGVVPGVKIIKRFNSMFNDPVCYEVKGSRIALRNRESKYIEVEKYYG